MLDDVVNALFLVRNIDCRGEVNISLGKEINLLELKNSIEESLGTSIKIKNEPGKLGEQRRSCLSNIRAKDVLNWEPNIDLAEGVKRTINWAKSIL